MFKNLRLLIVAVIIVLVFVFFRTPLDWFLAISLSVIVIYNKIMNPEIRTRRLQTDKMLTILEEDIE